MSRLAKDPDEVEPISMIEGVQRQQEDEEITPLPASDSQPYPGGISSAVGSHLPKWHKIIWREWRNCEDEEYARHLFHLVAKEPVSWSNKITISLFGALFGTLVGLLLDLLLTPTAPPVFGWLGGIGGSLVGFWLARQISMRAWLAILTPNNIFKDLAWPYKLLLLGLLVGLFAISDMWLRAGFLGLIVGSVFGLVLGLLSWPFLSLVGLSFFRGQMLAPQDILISWVSVGVGLGVGVLLGAKPNLRLESGYRFLCFWWKKRPLMTEVLDALQLASRGQSEATTVWSRLLSRSKKELEALDSSKDYIAMLDKKDWEKRFIARQALMTLGAEAVVPLLDIAMKQDAPLQQTALWLLQSIERETTARLARQTARPLCARCLVRCQAYMVSISPDIFVTYHGCRICRQSRDILDGKVVAVLNARMNEEWISQDNQVRINWLSRRSLFDFDKVEIIQATDEEVERFAMQVGNDTDPFRRPRYSQMTCWIRPECQLSENTLRILESMFGQVITHVPNP